ncbi:hypothetical protein L0Y46_04920, partial [bacterium]|nr:hypothetical protein [bacterium]
MEIERYSKRKMPCLPNEIIPNNTMQRSSRRCRPHKHSNRENENPRPQSKKSLWLHSFQKTYEFLEHVQKLLTTANSCCGLKTTARKDSKYQQYSSL